MDYSIIRYLSEIKLSETETEKRKELLELMNKWRDSLADKEFVDWFYTDGFFPNYYNQKHKVLFIGWEARNITTGGDDVINGDYIGTSLGWLKKDKQGDHSFWGRIVRMMQLFKSEGRKEFEQLKSANDYVIEMFEKNDFGFALMNISKYSNDVKREADWYSINKFLEDSQLDKHNYFQKEIKILDPDYIITFNLLENINIKDKYLKLCFGEREQPKDEYPKNGSPDGKLFEIYLYGKKVKLADIYHPSAPQSVKPSKECFYMPIKELLFPDGNMRD